MNRTEFVQMLADEHFGEVVTVSRAADGFLGTHAHPFEAKALILKGDLRLQVGASEQVYQAGQVFHLRANESHSEFYGPDGVEYLVGRK